MVSNRIRRRHGRFDHQLGGGTIPVQRQRLGSRHDGGDRQVPRRCRWSNRDDRIQHGLCGEYLSDVSIVLSIERSGDCVHAARHEWRDRDDQCRRPRCKAASPGALSRIASRRFGAGDALCCALQQQRPGVLPPWVLLQPIHRPYRGMYRLLRNGRAEQFVCACLWSSDLANDLFSPVRDVQHHLWQWRRINHVFRPAAGRSEAGKRPRSMRC